VVQAVGTPSTSCSKTIAPARLVLDFRRATGLESRAHSGISNLGTNITHISIERVVLKKENEKEKKERKKEKNTAVR